MENTLQKKCSAFASAYFSHFDNKLSANAIRLLLEGKLTKKKLKEKFTNRRLQ